MADRVVQLLDDAGDKIYPISTLPDGQAYINVTNVDPGEGSSLQQDHYTAVYGSGANVPEFTLTNVDPGEGSALGEDEYVAVYGAAAQDDEEIVTRFVFKANRAAQYGHEVKYTKKGTPIDFYWHQYGASVFIGAGAENIQRAVNAIEVYGNTVDYIGGVGLASGATLWGYFSGFFEATGQNSRSTHTTVGSFNVNGDTIYYGDFCRPGQQKDCTGMYITLLRIPRATNQWNLFGHLATAGSATAVAFEGEFSCFGAGAIPTLYQRGVSNAQTMKFHNVWEIYEDNV